MSDTKDKTSNCYVHLGRFGDLMILLPGWKREFERTGQKPVVLVAEEFASIFDGVSYVQPWPQPFSWWKDAERAKQLALGHFEKVIVPKWWEVKSPPKAPGETVKAVFRGDTFEVPPADWQNYHRSQWRGAGFDEAGLKVWPLVFDRRDARREKALAERVFKTDQPKLLLNLKGNCSPFAAVPEVMAALEPLRRKNEIVDLAQVRAERIYDLLGLFERAAGLLTVDTATLHLAKASKLPYVALLQNGLGGSVTADNCHLEVRYANAPEMAGKICAALEEITRPKPVQKNCWMLEPKPKVAIAYLYPLDARETFVPFARRWVEFYKRFAPTLAHEVIVAMSNGQPDARDFSVFDGVPAQFNTDYHGGGWDIGNFQHLSKKFNHDLIVFMNSRSFLWRTGWLERFLEAFERFGPNGLYGATASFESCPIPNTFPAPNPHIRTACFVTNPKILRQFPHLIDSREQSFKFESGEWNVSNWYLKQGWPVKLVTADGFYDRHDWRKPRNIFRRGNQSNCLVADRHTLLYARASSAEKRGLADRADAGMALVPRWLPARPAKTITVVAATSLNACGHARAIERTASLIPHPCEKLLISSEPVPGFTGRQLPLPKPWATNGKWEISDMCDFLLTGLHKYIATDVAIIVHDDGYALNQARWTNNFLDYDYIGAPWPGSFHWTMPSRRVGNGGFSLRSKRWLQAAAKLPKLPRGISEDVYANVTRATHFTRAGCRIAPVWMAMRWSFEHCIEEYPGWKLSDSFGFHGLTSSLPERQHLKLTASA